MTQWNQPGGTRSPERLDNAPAMDTSMLTPNYATRPAPQRSQPTPSLDGKTHEHLAFLMIVCFVGGVLLYTFLPAGWVRVSGMTGFVAWMVYVMYHFGIKR